MYIFGIKWLRQPRKYRVKIKNLRRALERQTTETKEPKLKISGALSGAGAEIFVK
jgi:hypothetical protein